MIRNNAKWAEELKNTEKESSIQTLMSVVQYLLINNRKIIGKVEGL